MRFQIEVIDKKIENETEGLRNETSKSIKDEGIIFRT